MKKTLLFAFVLLIVVAGLLWALHPKATEPNLQTEEQSTQPGNSSIADIQAPANASSPNSDLLQSEEIPSNSPSSASEVTAGLPKDPTQIDPETPPVVPPRGAIAQRDSNRALRPDGPAMPVRQDFRDLEALEMAETPPDADGKWTRSRVVEATDMKYPYILVEEKMSRDPATGETKVDSVVEMVADHIIVKLNADGDLAQLEELCARNGAKILRKMRIPHTYLVHVGDHRVGSVSQAVEVFKNNSASIAYAEPDIIAHLNSHFPNDPQFPLLWGLHNVGQAAPCNFADIDAPEAWDIAQGNHNVVVGVIDTGIDYTHEDLAENIWSNPNETSGDANGDGYPGVSGVDDDGDGLIDEGLDELGNEVSRFLQDGATPNPEWVNNLVNDDDENGYEDDIHGWDFVRNGNIPMDDNGHGSHVAGTIGAKGNNGVGVVGVCWSVQLMPIKAFNALGSLSSDLAEAINYATENGARLTSNSYGWPGYDQTIYDIIAAARSAGRLFVAAAGNNGIRDNDNLNENERPYPASYDLDNIIAVAATDSGDRLANFSHYGITTVDVGAPGQEIYSTIPGGYGQMDGTSMAAPHVAGLAALIWSMRADLTFTEVRAAILEGVDRIPDLEGKSVSGGRINAFNSLVYASPHVTGSIPQGGGVLHVKPTDFAVTFSEDIAIDSIDAAGFRVNGNPANSADAESGRIVHFRYSSSPVTAQGTYTMELAANSVHGERDYAGNPSWSASFTIQYDSSLDSDDDGWDDAYEYQSGSNPFDDTSVPVYFPLSLGTLLGGDFSIGTAINNRGVVAGTAMDENGEYRAFRWSAGQMNNLGTLPGGDYSYASGINMAGGVVGVARNLGGEEQAFLWHDGTMSGLDPLPSGGMSRHAYGINDAAQIAGVAETAQGELRAAQWDGEEVSEISTSESAAHAINHDQKIAGMAETAEGSIHAMLWASGLAQDLDAPDGAESIARAISDDDRIVGSFRDSANVRHAFAWNGSMSDLDSSLSGASGEGVNTRGQVVGYSEVAGGTTRALLWQNEKTLDLNDLLPPGSDWLLDSAEDVNDFGVIVGKGQIDGAARAYVLTPDVDGDGLADPFEFAIVNYDATDDINAIADVLPGDDYDGDGVSNGDEYAAGTNPTDPHSDLVVTVAAHPAGASAGKLLYYTIAVSNRGPDAASGVILRNDIPLETSIQSSGGGTVAPSGNSITWSLPAIAKGRVATRTVTVKVSPVATHDLENMSQLSGTYLDPHPEDNSVLTVTGLVQSPAFAVTSLDGPNANAWGIPPDVEIGVNFTLPVSAPSVDEATFKVSGNLSGPYMGDFTVVDNHVAFAHLPPLSRPFKAGEKITTVLTRGILDDSPSVMELEPYAFNYTAASKVCDHDFVLTSQGQVGSEACTSIAAGDVNGDGFVDLLVSSYSPWYPYPREEFMSTRIYLNNQQGGFTPGDKLFPSPGPKPTTDVGLADFDGNGTLDAWVTVEPMPYPYAYYPGSYVFMNDGEGHFTQSQWLSPGSTPRALALGDIDLDGDIDAVSGGIVYTNTGGGLFRATTDLGDSETAALGDLDGDGYPDLVMGGRILINDKGGSFFESGNSVGCQIKELADVDGNRSLDVVGVTDRGAIMIFTNDGSAFFAMKQEIPASGTYFTSATVADMNGDASPDIHACNYMGANRVYLNNGRGVFTDSGKILGLKETRDSVVFDIDNDGIMDIVDANNGRVRDQVTGEGIEVWHSPLLRDLKVEAGASPTPALPGKPLTYSITVYNLSLCDASGTVVSSTVPQECSYVEGSATLGGMCSDVDEENGTGGLITWNLGTIAARSSVVVEYTVTVGYSSCDMLSSTARVVSLDSTDPRMGDNTRTTVTAVRPDNDLELEAKNMSMSSGRVDPGGSITISAIIHNNGQTTQHNVPVGFYLFENAFKTETIDEIAPGEGVTVSTTKSFDFPGPKVLSVRVDPDNVIPENCDNNNNASKILFVNGESEIQARIVVVLDRMDDPPANCHSIISGTAVYELVLDGVVDRGEAVQGAKVSITIRDSSQSIIKSDRTYTDQYGGFYFELESPEQPNEQYLVTIVVDDKTITGEKRTSFITKDEACPGDDQPSPDFAIDVCDANCSPFCTIAHPDEYYEVNTPIYNKGDVAGEVWVNIYDGYRDEPLGGLRNIVVPAGGESVVPLFFFADKYPENSYALMRIELKARGTADLDLSNNIATRVIKIGTPEYVPELILTDLVGSSEFPSPEGVARGTLSGKVMVRLWEGAELRPMAGIEVTTTVDEDTFLRRTGGEGEFTIPVKTIAFDYVHLTLSSCFITNTSYVYTRFHWTFPPHGESKPSFSIQSDDIDFGVFDGFPQVPTDATFDISAWIHHQVPDAAAQGAGIVLYDTYLDYYQGGNPIIREDQYFDLDPAREFVGNGKTPVPFEYHSEVEGAHVIKVKIWWSGDESEENNSATRTLQVGEAAPLLAVTLARPCDRERVCELPYEFRVQVWDQANHVLHPDDLWALTIRLSQDRWFQWSGQETNIMENYTFGEGFNSEECGYDSDSQEFWWRWFPTDPPMYEVAASVEAISRADSAIGAASGKFRMSIQPKSLSASPDPDVLNFNSKVLMPAAVAGSAVPYFSAIAEDPDGAPLIGYALEVSGDPEFQTALLWRVPADTNEVFRSMCPVESGERCWSIPYEGAPLTEGETNYWRIRFFDAATNGTPWSDAAPWADSGTNYFVLDQNADPNDWDGIAQGIEPTGAPVFYGVPGDVTVPYSEVPAVAQVVALGADGSSLPVAYSQIETGTCPRVITRTWTAANQCSGTATASQRITLLDEDPPVLFGVLGPATAACGSLPAVAAVTATDNGVSVPVHFAETPDGTCATAVTRTWTATDACGNSTQGVQVITLLPDVETPVLSEIPANVTVPCDAIPAPATVTATDNCAANVAVHYAQTADGECATTLTRTWTATDACGNSTQGVQVITLLPDIEAPVLNEAPADATVPCDAIPVPPTVTATDNYLGSVPVTFVEDDSQRCSSGILIRTWTASDPCGNATQHVQTIHFGLDTERPVLSGVPADLVVACDAVPAPAEVTAVDNCGGTVSVQYHQEAIGNCTGKLIRTWTATDACGNSTSATQRISLEEDSVLPVLIDVPADVVTCGAIPPVDAVTATDNCSSAAVTFGETTNGLNPAVYSRVWTATDGCGNTASATQLVSVYACASISGSILYSGGQTGPIWVAAAGNSGESRTVRLETPGAYLLPELRASTDYLVTAFRDSNGNWSNDVFEAYGAYAGNPVSLSGDLAGINFELHDPDGDEDGLPDWWEQRHWGGCDYGPTDDPDGDGLDNAEEYILGTNPTLADSDGDGHGDGAEHDLGSDPLNPSSFPVCIAGQVSYSGPATGAVRVEVRREAGAALPVCTALISGPGAFAVSNVPTLSNYWISAFCDVDGNGLLGACEPRGSWAGNPVLLTNHLLGATLVLEDDIEAPTLHGVPADDSATCSFLPVPPVVTATDNWSGEVGVQYLQVQTGGCTSAVVRTWSAADACGNAVTATQTITMIVQPPHLLNVPADTTWECSDAMPPTPLVTVEEVGACKPSPGEGLVLYYPFDEDLGGIVRDASGGGRTGQVNGATWVADGARGGAYRFNDNSQNISATDAGLPAGDAPRSVAAWMMLETNYANGCTGMFSYGTPASNQQITLGIDWRSGRNQYVFSQYGSAFLSARKIGGTGVWVHVVYTYGGSGAHHLYVDGLPSDGLQEMWGMINTVLSGVLRLGGQTGSTGLAGGYLDEVMIFDRALSAEEVFALCRGATPVQLVESSEGACPNVITRVWTATNACGDTVSATQRISTVDTKKPTMIVPADKIIGCEESASPTNTGTATATDLCNPPSSLVVSCLDVTNGTCPGIISRTWSATDPCGNSTSAVQTITVATNWPFGGGDGSAGNPYLVNCIEHLNNIRGNYLDKHFQLAGDIDASPTVLWKDVETGPVTGFMPIGDSSSMFRGVLDGMGYSIDRLWIVRPSRSGTGLFGYLSDATIRNLTLSNARIEGNGQVGILSGVVQGTSLVADVVTTGSVTSHYTVVGGIFGTLGVGSSMYRCRTEARVVSTYYGCAGGLVYQNSGSISNCCANGYVQAGNILGGLVGVQAGILSDSYSASTVVGGTGDITGGLVGNNQGITRRCYSAGIVTGNTAVGGLAGKNWSSGTLLDSFTVGSVTGKVASTFALAGGPTPLSSFGSIVNCFWNNRPGIPGSCCPYASVDCTAIDNDITYFYDSTHAPMDSWDFISTWRIPEGGGLPVLR